MTLRVAFFGSGSEYSRIVLEALHARADVVAVVIPAASGPQRIGRRALMFLASHAIRRLARRIGARLVRYSRTAPPVEQLRLARPDLLIVASFPFRLPDEILQVPQMGAVNVHPSLLPSHRGADPLFWSYFHDEPFTGASLHWLDRGLDTGDLIAQELVRIERGSSARATAAEIARIGASLVAAALPAIERGSANRVPQPDGTTDPLPGRAGWTIDWAAWPAERVWHFLRGVGAGQGHRLVDRAGETCAVGRARTWTAATVTDPPGTIRRQWRGWTITCRDGYVEAAPPALVVRAYRTLAFLRRVLRTQRHAAPSDREGQDSAN